MNQGKRIGLLTVVFLLAALAFFFLRDRWSGADGKALTRAAEAAANGGSTSPGIEAAAPGRAVELVTRCHDAVRRELGNASDIELDEGVAPTAGVIYTHTAGGVRFVGLAKAPVDPKYDQPLGVPGEGKYVVNGAVKYDKKGPASDELREFSCAADVPAAASGPIQIGKVTLRYVR